MKHTILVIFLLSIFAGLAISSMPKNSGTCDEIAHHIPVGYVLLTKQDFKMDASQPPLSRYIVALPLKIFMNVNLPDKKEEWRRSDRSEFGQDFFYKYNTAPKKMLFLSRLAVVMVGILCAIVLFIWARALYGNKAALFSLFLYAFSPNIIANATLSTTDMVATCFILLSVATFWLFVKNMSPRNIIIAGFCLGLAQLSKYTAALLYPMFLLLLLFEIPSLDKNKQKSVALKFLFLVCLSFFTAWAGYGFEFKPILYDASNIKEKIEIAHSLIKKIIPFASDRVISSADNFLLNVPVPLGTHILGIMGVLRHNYTGHLMYFLGKWSEYGNPFYFLTAFLIKTPIPTLIFFFLGIFAAFKQKLERNERFIITTILLFFISASFSKLQIGLRYILVIYPFCFILASKSLGLFKVKFFKVFSYSLMLLLVFVSFKTWPHYLSYFNEFIGGANNGWKYLRDSNIDWGQDLPTLTGYLKKNNINKIAFLYFGEDRPANYEINAEKFSENEFKAPQKKVYAISAQYIDSVEWAKINNPTAKAGYSIFIYDLRGK